MITKLIYKVLCIFDNSKTYKKCKNVKRAYYNIYCPLLNKLYPYSFSYNEDDDEMLKTLVECRNILLSEPEINNPSLIKRINCIVDFDGKLSQTPSVINRTIKDKNKTKYRQGQFECIVREVVRENNRLRSSLSIPKISFTQRLIIDKFTNDSVSYFLKVFLGTIILSIVFLIIIYYFQSFM